MQSFNPPVVSAVGLGLWNYNIIYVPDGSEEAYQQAEGWKNFTQIEPYSVSIDRNKVELSRGESVPLNAKLKLDVNVDKTLTWSSSDESVATVNADGLVTSVGVGDATIKASWGGVSAECKVVVTIPVSSVVLDRTSVECVHGDRVQLTATVNPDDATDKSLSWSSSDDAVATVDTDGQVTAIGAGEATITVICGGVSAECKVVVTIPVSSVELDKADVECTPGDKIQLTATVNPDDATDKSLTWSSSDETVATVDANGQVITIGVGEATITVSCGGVSAECKVVVNAKIISVGSVTLDRTSVECVHGDKVQLMATVNPDDATDKNLTWRSSDETVATVNANGQLTAIGVGEATITVTCGGASAECKVVVNAKIISVESVTLDRTSVECNPGDKVQLTATVNPDDATDKSLSWSSSDEAVATVDVNGQVTAVGVGEATITVTCGGASATCVVVVKSAQSGITSAGAGNVNVCSEMSKIIIDGAAAGEYVRIFNLSGKEVFHAASTGDCLTYDHAVSGVYIVYVGSEAFKIVVR